MWFLCVGLCGIVGDGEVLNGTLDVFFDFFWIFSIFFQVASLLRILDPMPVWYVWSSPQKEA